MTSYRRNFVPGGSFFFTVNLPQRRLSRLSERLGLLRTAFCQVRQRHPFSINAIAILHDVFMPPGMRINWGKDVDEKR
jgi:putative transposase